MMIVYIKLTKFVVNLTKVVMLEKKYYIFFYFSQNDITIWQKLVCEKNTSFRIKLLREKNISQLLISVRSYKFGQDCS